MYRNTKIDSVFVSEPGYYKENDFGIRIEDIVVTIPANTKVKAKLYFIDHLQLVVTHQHYEINEKFFYMNVFPGSGIKVGLKHSHF